MVEAGVLWTQQGRESHLQIDFDGNRCKESVDFRPQLPIIFRLLRGIYGLNRNESPVFAEARCKRDSQTCLDCAVCPALNSSSAWSIFRSMSFSEDLASTVANCVSWNSPGCDAEKNDRESHGFLLYLHSPVPMEMRSCDFSRRFLFRAAEDSCLNR